jgi:transcriptional regulator with XRE-family HTH domain
MDANKTGMLIAAKRKEKGMTQKELAERLHISNKAVSRWETGVIDPAPGELLLLLRMDFK